MVKINVFIIIVLIISAILSFLSLGVSIWVYTYDYNSKLAAHSSSDSEQANVGLNIESESAGGGSTGGASTSGSGGGGGVAYGQPLFQVNEDSFNIKVVSGDEVTNEVLVNNLGNSPITIQISATGIDKYISFSSKALTINAGSSAPLKFTIKGPEPGVYAGRIVLTYQGVSKEILILLNVVSEGTLFDVTITVPDLYRILREGQRLPALIELLEVGQETGVDVTMNYIIKDFDDKEYYSESETFYVSGAKSYSKRFSTAGLKPGDYILGVELIYSGGFATSTAHFRISDSLITPQSWVSIGALVIAIIVCILAIMFYRHNRNKFKPQRGKLK